MRGFYPVCNSNGVIVVYLDLPSRQNTQRAGHVRLFLFWHLPFHVEGYPIHCFYFISSIFFFFILCNGKCYDVIDQLLIWQLVTSP